jgi:HD-GYP domain-containing protein (c-di-GMP phosphodiesterase class II)
MPMRVLAIADVYEALTEERPYRRAWSSEAALEIIRSEVPERFDRDAFDALRTLVDRRSAGERQLVTPGVEGAGAERPAPTAFR